MERLELVTVFASGDPAELAVAKLVLEAERIPFVTVGEGVQDLFGWGRVLGPLNLATGPVQLRVREQDGVRALQALKSVKTDKE